MNWEQFSPQVRQQILDMSVMGLGGMVIGLFRTVDLVTMKRIRAGAVTAWILEVLFWVMAGFCAAEFLYYCAYGALSVHSLAALWLGFVLWKRIFCREIVTFAESVFCRQNLTRWGIIKRSVDLTKPPGEHIHGKDETKPLVQKRTRKQRHRHR